MQRLAAACIVLAWLGCGCSQAPSAPEPAAAQDPPSILLVTLDTTRADSLGLESDQIETPSLEALAARGTVFTQAWTTAPMTLPAHTSMLTGLYPAEHGVRENSRFVAASHTLLGERLRQAGYTTAAFVSGYPLKRSFGLARGFDHYDDHLGEGNAERRADETTGRALEYLGSAGSGPVFVWVHYFDPHEPYAPPEPFRSRYASAPYLGEIAFMDQEAGRLIEGFEQHCQGASSRILVLGDHGEGLGDHGEALHGDLLYQSVMRVPMIMAGTGIPAGVIQTPVSIRRVFDTILAWAGLGSGYDLLSADTDTEVVLGEALRPFLHYGWQPQVMAVTGTTHVIQAGGLEVYDLAADPGETDDLSGSVEPGPSVLAAIRAYDLVPDPDAMRDATLDQEARQQLASLGYASWDGPVAVREDAPRPRDMVHLLDDLDEGSRLFARERYAAAIKVFERVLAKDDENLMVTLRLAVCRSLVGDEREADRLFRRAEEIQPGSIDLKHFLAMHYFRLKRGDLAGPLFEEVLRAMPQRLPAIEALARIREREGRLDDAAMLLRRAIALKDSPAAEWVRLGELKMATGGSEAAIEAFEEARALQGEAFEKDLELGVCYLAAGRPAEAAAALDRVPASHPGFAMALFKRAQASVLLGEPDWRDRVRHAYQQAGPEVRHLIDTERLFQGMTGR